MATVARTAHIKLTGFDTQGVDAYSPLEDQVSLTYRAAYHYASANGFKPYVHRGVQGRRGPMVMKRITDSLFDHPDSTVRSKLNGLVTQVLRKTDAVVCVKRPPDNDRDTMPEWFVADRMPPNLTIVALSHAGADKPVKTGVGPTPLVPTHRESKLTAHEAGEDLAPGEVTVKKKPESKMGKTRENRIASLREHQDKLREEHAALVEEVYRLIAAHPAVGVPELRYLAGQPDKHNTHFGTPVRELAEAGRIVSRVETDDERRMRGGGSMPKGQKLTLWTVAPGPVPIRTALPEGVPARKGALDWSKEKKERLDKLCDTVLDVMNTRVPAGQPRVKSVGRIAEAAGLSFEDTHMALDRLIQLDLVYKGERSGNYHLTERRRGPNSVRHSDNGSPDQDEVEAEASQPATVAPDIDTMTDEIAAVIQKYVMDGESEQLREQLREAQATIAKQTKIITGLKGVIAAMEE